jgi:uncharacterized membrane protein YjjB (DUF3815 family)
VNLPSLLTTLELAGFTFLGGAAGWLSNHLSAVPTTAGAWESIAIGAACAGVIALVQRYRPVPGAPPGVTTTLELVGCSFLGGAAGWISNHLSQTPTTSSAWESFAIGAACAGLVAVVQRYRPVPGSGGSTPPPSAATTS